MKRIRIGNDIMIKWDIFTPEDAPYYLDGKDINVTLLNSEDVEESIEWEVKGNSIRASYKGKDQVMLGDYLLVLTENAGEEDMKTIDHVKAFSLVAHSIMEGGCECSHLSVTYVELKSNMCVPADGLSAYEIAVIHGFEGTEEEWLESLHGDCIWPLFSVDENMMLSVEKPEKFSPNFSLDDNGLLYVEL